jgi:hypothetical protein
MVLAWSQDRVGLYLPHGRRLRDGIQRDSWCDDDLSTITTPFQYQIARFKLSALGEHRRRCKRTKESVDKPKDSGDVAG